MNYAFLTFVSLHTADAPPPCFPVRIALRGFVVMSRAICHRDQLQCTQLSIAPSFVYPRIAVQYLPQEVPDGLRLRFAFGIFGPATGADLGSLLEHVLEWVVGGAVGRACQSYRYPLGQASSTKK